MAMPWSGGGSSLTKTVSSGGRGSTKSLSEEGMNTVQAEHMATAFLFQDLLMCIELFSQKHAGSKLYTRC